MKRTALLIDGAYLRAVATKQHGFDSEDYTADFIEKFALKCFDKEEEELFRIFYYDCLPNKKQQRYPVSGRKSCVHDKGTLARCSSPQKALRRSSWRGSALSGLEANQMGSAEAPRR